MPQHLRRDKRGCEASTAPLSPPGAPARQHSAPARQRRLTTTALTLCALTAAVICGPSFGAWATADGPVALGSASTFLTLAGTGGLTNTGPSLIAGDIGVSADSPAAGLPPTMVGGTEHLNDSSAHQAQLDTDRAYQDAYDREPTDLFAGDQSAAIFTPGVHRTAGAFTLAGTLTLDAKGDPSATFIFQIGDALTSAASSTIHLINGTLPGRVFWQVTGAVTVGANATFIGTVLSHGAITIGDHARILGQLLTTAAVTLSSNTVTRTVDDPPLIQLTQGPTTFTLDNTPTISGTVWPPTASATVTIAGQRLLSGVDTAGRWAVTAGQLPNGRYPISVSVTDTHHNQGSAFQTLTIGNWTAPVPLGDATTFLALGSTGITSSGPTVISANVGAGAGKVIAGLARTQVGGTTHLGDPQAQNALDAAHTAYLDAAQRTPTEAAFAGDQNGRTFYAGVQRTNAAFGLTGTLTFDGQNDPDGIFIVQMAGALTAASASHIALVRGAQANHVFWQAAGAVTVGANADFSGTLLSAGAITLGAGARLHGQAFATGVLTLADNALTFNDAPPPLVHIDGGTDAFTVRTPRTLTGSATAASSTVIVTVAGQQLTAPRKPDGTWTVSPTAIGNGRYDVVARTTDPAGNQGSYFQTLTVGNYTPALSLGVDDSFAVLGGTGVINTLATTVVGDVGVGPGAVITGLPDTSPGPATPEQAMHDRLRAYNEAANRIPLDSFAGDQNGQTFHAGVLSTDAAFGLTGTLTLDGQHDPNGVFIIQVGGALTTAAASTVTLINGAQAANVFWQVNGAATLGANSTFAGTILADGAITVGDSAALTGRTLALGTVTMAHNTVQVPVLISGGLSITVPTALVDLGTLDYTALDPSLHAALGAVQVTDDRPVSDGASWTVSVSMTAFTYPGGPTIDPTQISYTVGPMDQSGTGTLRALDPQDLTTLTPALNSTGIDGGNAVTWDPTLNVHVPLSALQGRYTATITHSVL